MVNDGFGLCAVGGWGGGCKCVGASCKVVSVVMSVLMKLNNHGPPSDLTKVRDNLNSKWKRRRLHNRRYACPYARGACVSVVFVFWEGKPCLVFEFMFCV